ncbi:MAG: uroporphyrinogen-III synthase [Planctomycetaceae bacterium]
MSETRPLVCTFESRRSSEMQSLIVRHGGEGFTVPTMQEVPLEDNGQVVEFANRLEAGDVDFVVFMTGVGARTVADALGEPNRFEAFVEALGKAKVIVRGPKPKVVLREWGLSEFYEVKEPNTWRELLVLIDETPLDVSGKTIAVQEYGIPNKELYSELQQRGAVVMPVPVYRWKLPDDVEPIRVGIQRTIAGDFDALMFTSANQIRNVLQVAGDIGLRDQFLAAAKKTLVSSVGPTCSETLANEGLRVGFEASPPKMGPLVRGTMQVLVESTSSAD